MVVYEEVQRINTDAYGRINTYIGLEDPELFGQINWDGDRKDLKVEIDINGSGNDFVVMSQQASLRPLFLSQGRFS